jgi:hypothetical protein
MNKTQVPDIQIFQHSKAICCVFLYPHRTTGRVRHLNCIIIAGSGSTTATVSARSKHTGSVHVLLTDGSARFASSNIDLNSWRQLGNHQDGNIIGEW